MQEQDASLMTRHMNLLESLPVMILDLDGDGALRFANRRARQGLGLGDGALDLSIAELLDASNRDTVLAQIRELWSGEGEVTSTWKLRTTAGKVIQVDTNAISIHENSYPVLVRLYLHDGSTPAAAAPAAAQAAAAAAQAQLVGPVDARAALKEEREYTKALIQKSGLLVYIFDTQGVVVEVNKKMEDLTGFSRATCPTLEHLLRGLYPDERYRKIVSDVHKNMFKNQHLRETELKIATIKGEVRHISWSTARLKNAKGEVHGFIASGMDVTEKKRLEHWAKLQASCLERISDGVIISDLKGDVIQWLGRAEELLGYSAQEMEGKPFTELFPPGERQIIDELLADDIERAGQWRAEVELKVKGGGYRTTQVEVVVVRNEGGQAIALVTLIRDREMDKDYEERNSELERRVADATAQMEVFRARGDQLEIQLKEDQARAENYLARADAMASKNRDLEDEVARQAGGRAALEQAVEELSIFQLSLLGVSSISLVTTDGSGTITNWSRGAEEFCGLDAREAMGRRLHDEVFQIEGYDWDTIVQETLDRGGFRGPVTLVRGDGTRKPIILDTSVLNDEKGNAVGLTEIAVEFTGSAADPDADRALFEARGRALLGDLTPSIAQAAADSHAVLSDHLKQLIERVRAVGQILSMYRQEAPRAQIEALARRIDLGAVITSLEPSCDTVVGTAADLRNLARDLKRFLPASASELEILPLNEVVEAALHLARGSVVDRGRIERDYGAGTTILGSANEATRATLHLLLAAGHALDPESGSGRISVRTSARDERVTLEVRHNGFALSADVGDVLGDPAALVRIGHDSAVALGLAARQAAALGGSLSVGSVDGLEVYRLELPLAEADAATRIDDLDDAPEKPYGKVIFIDPDRPMLSAYQRYFGPRFDVEVATDIEELKGALKTKPKAGAIVLTGNSAEEIHTFHQFLLDYNKELAGKVVFLLPGGLSAAERKSLRRTGRVLLERPTALESLEGVLRLVIGG